jgi:uncharacterized membrane protein YgdD (TMEM256/DUF423 family)
MSNDANLGRKSTVARRGLMAAGINGIMGVGCGAFAAHGLKSLGDPQIVDWVKTGASYQLWHAAALLGLVSLADRLALPRANLLIFCFFVGPLIFAGSLYALALLQWHWLGAITPFGGVLMIIGWIGVLALGWRQTGLPGR